MKAMTGIGKGMQTCEYLANPEIVQVQNTPTSAELGSAEKRLKTAACGRRKHGSNERIYANG